jgi:hypothetical protein
MKRILQILYLLLIQAIRSNQEVKVPASAERNVEDLKCFLAHASVFLADPATAAGIRLTILGCQALQGALIFPPQIRFSDAMVNKIPGKALIRTTLSVDIEIRVYGHSFKGLGPVAAAGMGQ